MRQTHPHNVRKYIIESGSIEPTRIWALLDTMIRDAKNFHIGLKLERETEFDSIDEVEDMVGRVIELCETASAQLEARVRDIERRKNDLIREHDV